jgi:Sensors of blue-light using FAD
MRQLLYVSNTGRDVPDSFLDDILASSRTNNAKVGVTGVLLYLEGGLLQVLEGEELAVAETYAKICKDKRHWNTDILLDRDAPRAFGEWSMGFERPSAAAQADGMFAISRDAIDGKLKPGAPAEILALLRTFYRVNSHGRPA